MNKFLLAPAVAVVAGSMTLAGNVAFAATAPSPEAPEKTASVAASEAITVDAKDSYTSQELHDGITLTVKGLKAYKAEVKLSASGETLASGLELVDGNGVAKIQVKIPASDIVMPEYSIALFADDKKVDFDGPKTIKVPDSTIDFTVNKANVTAEDLTSSDTAPTISGDGLNPNTEYYISVRDPLYSEVERIKFTTDKAGGFSVQIVLPADKASQLIDEEFGGNANLVVKDSDDLVVGIRVSLKVTKTKEGDREVSQPEEETPTPEVPQPEEEAPTPEIPQPEEEAPTPEAPQPATPEAPRPDEDDQPEEEVAEYTLRIAPKEVTPKDFVRKTHGVQLIVTGLKPSEKFTYSVSKEDENGNVEDLFKEVKADVGGNWSHTVFGVEGGNGLDGFVGTYKVTVKSEAGVLTDTFKVTNTPGKKDDAQPGGKDDTTPGDKGDGTGKDDAQPGGKDNGKDTGKSNNAKGNGDSSNTLPRTGMELSGLIAGGALLTVGAATVLVTRRRTK